MMESENRVEVWLANGKRYCGQIVDFWPANASGYGSLVLSEDDRVFVLIHRVHVTRIDRVGQASSTESLASAPGRVTEIPVT